MKPEKSKKSQTEVVGLMIIVVMITMILLFSVRFLFNNKDTNKPLEEQNLAQSFVDAMLKTSSKCSESISIKEVLIGCVKSYSGYNTPKCENGQDKCSFAKKELKQLLDTTFNKWQTTYEFKVNSELSGDKDIIYLYNGNLSAKESGESIDQPLPVMGSTPMHVVLCIGSCG